MVRRCMRRRYMTGTLGPRRGFFEGAADEDAGEAAAVPGAGPDVAGGFGALVGGLSRLGGSGALGEALLDRGVPAWWSAPSPSARPARPRDRGARRRRRAARRQTAPGSPATSR